MREDTTEARIRYRREHSVDPETFLREAGVIESAEAPAQLQFSPEFTTALEGHLETVRDVGVGEAALARIFGVDETMVTALDRPYVAYQIRTTVRHWPSEGALELDVATDATLRETHDGWPDVPPRQRYRILQSLRSFQEACVFCGGPVSVTDQPVRSCCADRRVYQFGCRSCDRRFLEFSAEGTSDDSIGLIRDD